MSIRALESFLEEIEAPSFLSQQQKIVIDALNVSKCYQPNIPVLNGIDLSVEYGQRVALIGSNGSGKSTLLKCLIGLHSLSSGSVTTLANRFTQLPTSKQSTSIRLQTGFVFQHHCLVTRRSALCNVIHGMLGHSGSWRAFNHASAPALWREQAMKALEQVQLEKVASRRCDSLSGGQQHRVAIARALVRKPKLLVADEPAASLDPAAGHEVMSVFSKLCKESGITLLFTSHDMAHARLYADRIIALKHGEIVFDLPASQVCEKSIAGVFE